MSGTESGYYSTTADYAMTDKKHFPSACKGVQLEREEIRQACVHDALHTHMYRAETVESTMF